MKQYPKPLPVEAGATLYVHPEGKRFYHLRADCPCFKYERPQQIDIEQVRAYQMQPCFFCGYEPPPPPTRRERILGILSAPLAIFALPAGIISCVSGAAGILVALQLYCRGAVPLWGCDLVAAGIIGLGLWLDSRFSIIE